MAFDPNFASNKTVYVMYARQPDGVCGAAVRSRELPSHGRRPEPRRSQLGEGGSSTSTLLLAAASPITKGGQMQIGPDGDALHRLRRRRQRGRPEPPSADARPAVREDPAHRSERHRSRRRRRRLRDPRRKPLRAIPTTRPRSGCWACAIPGATRSTARPATCGSRDVGQGAREEIDCCLTTAAVKNYGWNVIEG